MSSCCHTDPCNTIPVIIASDGILLTSKTIQPNSGSTVRTSNEISFGFISVVPVHNLRSADIRNSLTDYWLNLGIFWGKRRARPVGSTSCLFWAVAAKKSPISKERSHIFIIINLHKFRYEQLVNTNQYRFRKSPP